MAKMTELVFILDRSGSMAGLESDTIGGYNAMLAQQKLVDGEACVTTVLFNHQYILLHDRIDIKAVSPITNKEYEVGGTTALLDAIGTTIYKIINVQKHTAEEYRADKVLFVIITDGMENSSREYDYDTVKKMVERQKNEFGWEFIFLGANIDAIEVAGRFGIARNRAQNYHADALGVMLNFAVAGEVVENYRKSGMVQEDWNAKIEEDYARRSKK